MAEIKKSKKLGNVAYDVRGPVLDAANELEAHGERILKLNIGNPAAFGFRAPEQVLRALRDGAVMAEGYSDSKGILAAREAIVKYEAGKGIAGLTADDVYTGNGASELITMALQALLDAGDELLVPAPDYPLWTASARLAGGAAVHYMCDEQNGWLPDLMDMRRKITSRTKGIVVINPNNPTGVLYPKELLEGVAALAREFGLVLFADEIYDRLCMDGLVHTSLASLAPDVFCVTFNGLSKSHRIAGYRCGWMCLSGDKAAAKSYIEGLNTLSSMRLCSNVLAQSVVAAALEERESGDALLSPGGRLFEQRRVVVDALSSIPGVSVVAPQAAFYAFPKLDAKRFNIIDDERFALDFLHAENVLVVHGGGFNWPRPDHFRIVYLPEAGELEQAMEKLERFLSGYRQ